LSWETVSPCAAAASSSAANAASHHLVDELIREKIVQDGCG
jgi:hypothetical protein